MEELVIPPTQEQVEEFNKTLITEDFSQQAAEKFTFKKINGLYFIIDTETGSKCITEVGKKTPFKTKVQWKLANELSRIREGYKKHLEQEEG